MENTCPHTASTDYRWSERGPFPEQQVHLTIHESQIVSGPTTEERSGRGSHLPLFSGQVRHVCSKEQTASRSYTSAKNRREPRSVDGSAGPARRASTCQPAKLSGSGRGLCSQHHLEHAGLGGPQHRAPFLLGSQPCPPEGSHSFRESVWDQGRRPRPGWPHCHVKSLSPPGEERFPGFTSFSLS